MDGATRYQQDRHFLCTRHSPENDFVQAFFGHSSELGGVKAAFVT